MMINVTCILLLAQTPVLTWEAALREVASRSNRNVVVDVVRTVEPLTAPSNWSAENALSLIAGATWCSLTETDSAIVVHRHAPTGSHRGLLTSRFVQFFEGLTGDQVSSLVKGEAHLSDFNGGVMAPLMASLSLDSQNLAVMLESPESVGISLGFTLTAEYEVPATNQPRIATIVQAVSPPPARAAAKQRREAATSIGQATPKKPSNDTLLIEPGRIWKVKDVVEAATKKLGVKFTYDKRFSDSEVFLSGSFTAEQFEESLRLVLTAGPFQRRIDGQDGVLNDALARGPLRSLLEQMFPSQEANEAIAAALSGQVVPASKLTGIFGSFREQLEREGVDPGGLSVRLKLEPTFKIRIVGFPLTYPRYGIVIR